jgi:hypothetical protein
MVPREGVEPSYLSIPDFESGASANSAIWAIQNSMSKLYNNLNIKATTYSVLEALAESARTTF